jgi:hypothetical protein
VIQNAGSYRIAVEGVLDCACSDRLDGIQISAALSPEGRPMTILAGPLVDQTALLGILTTLYDLHLTIVSVERES